MRFQPVDRLPRIEWAFWWNQTLERWYQEGLPSELTEAAAIRDWFGLDSYEQYWLPVRGPQTPPAPKHGAGLVTDRGDYHELRKYYYPEETFDEAEVAALAERQASGETVVWVTLTGFFWFPRTLLGIERHLYAFYDQPDLMREMNEDLLEHHVRTFEKFAAICRPDFMTFAEDMSYNHGPMLSEALFDEFIAPYYERITPLLHEHGTVIIVDSDGEVSELVPWMQRVGVDGFLPLERRAGVDVAALRRNHPCLNMIGAFDKMVMHQGEAALRGEFERLLPTMKSGGYLPSCDHQTPPQVSLEDYRLYLRLLWEYTEEAAR
jgi:hypothetical protein